uniref:HYR domain-containing protein n=1 Tax=Lotharella globosa TaxID=91324 RepID=A0A7S3Z9V2_9EUKA
MMSVWWLGLAIGANALAGETLRPILDCSTRVVEVVADPGKCSWTDTEGMVQGPVPIGAEADWFARNKWSMTRGVNTSFTLVGKSYAVGTTNVFFTGVSQEGKPVQCVTKVVTKDTQAPVWHGKCGERIRYPADQSLCSSGVTWDKPVATDNCGALKYEMPSLSSLESILEVGVTRLNYVAIDGSGNRQSCPMEIEIVDDQPPELECPPFVVARLRDNVAPQTCQTGAVATWKCKAKDNCGAVEYSCDKPSGSVFPMGTTEVHCSATDKSGNTKSARVSVAVVDLYPPRIRCPESFEVGLTTGDSKAIAVRWPEPKASDNGCNLGIPLERDGLASGSELPVGKHDIEYSVTDQSGLSSKCSFSVTVHDFVPPSFGEKKTAVVPGLIGDIKFRQSRVEEDYSDWQTVRLINIQSEDRDDKPTGVDRNASNWQTGSINPILDKPLGKKLMTADMFKETEDDRKLKLYQELLLNLTKMIDSHALNHTKLKGPKQNWAYETAKILHLVNEQARKAFKGNPYKKLVKACPTDIAIESIPHSPYGIARFLSPVAEDEHSNVSYKGPTFIQPGMKFPVGETQVSISALDADENEARCRFKVNVHDNQGPAVGYDAAMLMCPKLPDGTRKAGVPPYQQCGGQNLDLLNYDSSKPIVMRKPTNWTGPTECCRDDYMCVGDDRFKSCLPKGITSVPLPHDCGGEGYSESIRTIKCERAGHLCVKACAAACWDDPKCMGFAAHDMGCGSAVYNMGDPNFDVWCPDEGCPPDHLRTSLSENDAHIQSRNITGFKLRSSSLGKCRTFGYRAKECVLKSYIAPVSTAASYSMEWDCYAMNRSIPTNGTGHNETLTPFPPPNGICPPPIPGVDPSSLPPCNGTVAKTPADLPYPWPFPWPDPDNSSSTPNPSAPTMAPTSSDPSEPTAKPTPREALFPTARPTVDPDPLTLKPTPEPTSSPTGSTGSPTMHFNGWEQIWASGNGDISGCYRPSGVYNGFTQYARMDGKFVVRYSKTDSGWDWCPADNSIVIEPCNLEYHRGGFSHNDHGRPAKGHIFNWADHNSTLETKCPPPTSRPTTEPTPNPTPLHTLEPTNEPSPLPSPHPTLQPSSRQPTRPLKTHQRETADPTGFPTRQPTLAPTNRPTCTGDLLVSGGDITDGVYVRKGKFNGKSTYVRQDGKVIMRYGSTDSGWDYCEAKEGRVDHVCSGGFGRLAYSRDWADMPELGKIMGWGLHWGNQTLSRYHCSAVPSRAPHPYPTPYWKHPTPDERTRFQKNDLAEQEAEQKAAQEAEQKAAQEADQVAAWEEAAREAAEEAAWEEAAREAAWGEATKETVEEAGEKPQEQPPTQGQFVSQPVAQPVAHPTKKHEYRGRRHSKHAGWRHIRL